MLSNIPIEISMASFSLVGIMTGYIWNNQSKRIDELKKKISDKPCNTICNHIGEIQTDIRWLKEEFKRLRK